jgi:hypothetical protein
LFLSSRFGVAARGNKAAKHNKVQDAQKVTANTKPKQT